MTSSSPNNERITRTQFSAWFSAFVGWVFDYYEVFVLTFLIVLIGQEFDLSAGQMAIVFSIQLAFLAIGGVFFGTLADRYGRTRILTITIVIYSVFTFARAFSFDYTSLIVLTAIAALGIGGEYGVGQTLVSETMPSRQRGWWSAWLYGGIFIGIMMGALVGGYIAPVIGWRWTFALSGLPVLVALYVRYTAPESHVWEERQRITRTGIDWSAFRRRAFIIPFLICLVGGSMEFLAYYGFSTFLPSYLVEYEGFELSQASWWVFFTALAGLAATLLGSYTMDRWGRRITLSYLAATATVSGLVLAFMWDAFLGSGSYWILGPFFFFYLGASCPVVFGALFSEQFPTDIRSTGLSASLQIARGIAGLAPLITAAIFPVYGYLPILLGATVLYFLVAVWAFMFKERRGQDMVEIDAELLESSPK